ncbi:hypothetical protein X275_10880 [Marinitoga sp. 1197]|uniref:hypothetical protein n=1 Tax=Marinitoga sp. 1197 TaxID=1428449 RepID=UPI000640FB51|nr:hypothetical protein [Marinitoga sp. 1197]KLO21141.1 hypothetical protein X275_10880 [Marinitoga sp. 1197]
MDRRKFRRISIFFLVIILINFLKIILVTDDYLYILNLSFYPHFELINNNNLYSEISTYKKIPFKGNGVLKFNSPGKKIIINISKKIISKSDNLFLVYNNTFKQIYLSNLTIFTQLNIPTETFKIIELFFKNNYISLPKQLYIISTEYMQSFFTPPNYIFLRKNDLFNGVIVHELSHYTFGYLIKKKNKEDTWPEILCESIRLKYLYLDNQKLYNNLLNKKEKNEEDIYSLVLKYPLIINKFHFFITDFINTYKNKTLSDKDFNNFYKDFERRENN